MHPALLWKTHINRCHQDNTCLEAKHHTAFTDDPKHCFDMLLLRRLCQPVGRAPKTVLDFFKPRPAAPPAAAQVPKEEPERKRKPALNEISSNPRKRAAVLGNPKSAGAPAGECINLLSDSSAQCSASAGVSTLATAEAAGRGGASSGVRVTRGVKALEKEGGKQAALSAVWEHSRARAASRGGGGAAPATAGKLKEEEEGPEARGGGDRQGQGVSAVAVAQLAAMGFSEAQVGAGFQTLTKTLTHSHH